MSLLLNLAVPIGLSAALTFGGLAGPSGAPRPAPIYSQQQQSAQIKDLAAARGQAERDAFIAAKGPLATHSRMRAVELQDLINRLEAGETVAPEEIDRALKR